MRLNPSAGCGCCEANILVWNETPQYPYDFNDLKAFYKKNGVGATDIYGLNGNIEYPKSLDKYQLIIIPMPLSCSILFSADNLLQGFYNRGHNRIIVTGEYGATWDACSLFANSIVSTLGGIGSTSTGLLYVFGGCAQPGGLKGAPSQSGPIVMKNTPGGLFTDASGNVTGGTPLAIAPSNDYCGDPPNGFMCPCTPFVPAASLYQGSGGCDLILTGDVNIFTGDCQGVFDGNKRFLINCATLFY